MTSISNQDLKKFFYGVYTFKKSAEYLAFYRCSEEQIENLEYDKFYQDRTKFSASVCIGLRTNAKKVSFDYKIAEISLRDTFDVYVNGILTVSKNEQDLETEGKLEEGKLDFVLPDGDKNVEIYFPIDTEVYIKNFQIDGEYAPLPPKTCNVLWLGDSITQGAGGFMGGQTYVNIVTRKMNYNSLNQGLGGYKFDTHILLPLPNFKPDKIFVALGTNEWVSGFEERAGGFFAKVQELYPGVPVLAITPLWRGDIPEKIHEYEIMKKHILDISKKYTNMRVIDGFEMIPHVSQAFWDNLHPNAWGYEMYANNLIKKIKELRF